jgi:hypothetical protein
MHSRPSTSSALRDLRGRAPRLLAEGGLDGPGSTDHARTRSSWWFSAGGYTAVSPDGDLATSTAELTDDLERLLDDARRRAELAHADAASAGPVRRAWPRPS